jgi:hypothetical protein
MNVMKLTGKRTQAWQLGENSAMELRLRESGKIRLLPDGGYELFSTEAVCGHGERAEAGDYFKVDSTGAPYPNGRAWFEAHHQWVGDHEYVQNPEPLQAWTVEEPVCAEIRFLLEQQRLTIDPDDSDRYFSAFLWGAQLSAARDAVVVFYDVRRTGNTITDVDFNFVARAEFDRTYKIL